MTWNFCKRHFFLLYSEQNGMSESVVDFTRVYPEFRDSLLLVFPCLKAQPNDQHITSTYHNIVGHDI